MAIESLSTSVLWRPDSHQHAGASKTFTSAPIPVDAKRKHVDHDDDGVSSNGSSFRGVLCSPGEADGAIQATVPCFQRRWHEHLSTSLRSWQPWSLPLPPSHPCWTCPKKEDFRGTRVAELWTSEMCGLAPQLLALLAAFAKDDAVNTRISKQLQCFLLWDKWLKQHGSLHEMQQLASFIRSLHANGSSSSFPRRLSKKFPLKVQDFLDSLGGLFSSSQGQSQPWLVEYLTLWVLYAEKGLPMHKAIREAHHRHTTPSPAEFLIYRALTSGFPQMALLAAKNRLQGPPNARALDAVHRLLALGSMIFALFSDLHLTSYDMAHRISSISSLEVFDDEWAVLMQNSLLSMFNDEVDALSTESEAEEEDVVVTRQPASSFQQTAELVLIIKAALHGGALWYQVAPAFAAAPEQVASPDSSSPELFSSECLFDRVPGEHLLGMSGMTFTVPQCVSNVITEAVDEFVHKLRGATPL